MVVLDNVVIFTKFFLELIIGSGIAFVLSTILVAVVLDMVAEYCEVKKEERELKKEENEKEKEKEKEKESITDEKNIKTKKKKQKS